MKMRKWKKWALAWESTDTGLSMHSTLAYAKAAVARAYSGYDIKPTIIRIEVRELPRKRRKK